jgi:hypothetical protein
MAVATIYAIESLGQLVDRAWFWSLVAGPLIVWVGYGVADVLLDWERLDELERDVAGMGEKGGGDDGKK